MAYAYALACLACGWCNSVCQNAGPTTNWDNISFNPTDSSDDPDCSVDPDFAFLNNVDKPTPLNWNWGTVNNNGIFGYGKNR
ncbi:hypothetical protein GUITHDRAFT_99939 [Guillardia theta CCMP2712]|uniref:Uncharacterized protein n=1 Tax=Guillardia theta (strain CCMP2712) TaxID=905079 RepID=L1K1X9_GUITC|nr:hypothetical protein GUITHDRAFT_99939 [Guillardia theta CCMP2712]EKX54460.1 hypothetical protein GUITHDRAFT_99939 [Guillardia theta CCMP2712]|eukprot:XP_005841440.1 hypothetical protein GUITHDRAFT_99939 [Guillardia theta CCMP2712]